MKIWILTTEYPPAFGGGIGTYVENVAKMYSSKGENVKIILRDNEDNRRYDNENLEVCRFKLKNSGIYSYMGEIQSMAYQYYEYLNKLLEEDKPDIIEIQEYNAIGYYILQNKKISDNYLNGIPVVIHLHTPQFSLFPINKMINYKLPNYWVGEMEKFCIKAADSLLCPSRFLAEKLQYLNPNVKIKVINLPFDITVDSSIDNAKEKDNNLFVYFGRIEYRKGVEQLMHAFENLWKKGYKCKLKLIGGDTDFYPKNQKLGEILRNRYSNRIEEGLLLFQKNTPQAQLVKDIKKARAVIIPSLYENFPNTCIMSMWLKMPVIVSKQGGQSEMVEQDGVNGYIFDHMIKGELESKILQVLNDSEEKLKLMGNNAKKRIENLCNIDDNYNYRIGFFKNVIKNQHNSSFYPFLNDSSIYKKEVDGKKGKLSIVIPYYNMGEYIDETIQSINKSSYKEKEIIIVNDGSKDKNSIHALDKYRNVSNIKIIDIENAGLANARNVGAKISSGEFLAFLDADDLVESNFYSKAIDILNRFSNVSYVYSWVKYFEGSNGMWTTFDIQLPYLLCHNMLNANTLIRRKDFLKYGQNRPEMEYGMEDYDMWISLAENYCFGVCIPEFLSLYRVRKNSMARGFNENNLLYLTQKITENHSKLYNDYGSEIYNILNANGPSYLYNNPSFYLPKYNESQIIYQRPKLKDILWRYKIWRGVIKVMQKIGMIKIIKKMRGKLNSENK